MPVVTLDYEDLICLLGSDPGPEELGRIIPSLGADMVRIDRREIEVEFFPDRPDLYSVEGLARALRYYLEIDTPKEYSSKPSGFTLSVDEIVKNVRPFIAAGIVRNIDFHDKLIASIMQAQEKLHGTIGRGRKKVAIGVHDLSDLNPPFFYRGVRDASFIPLGWEEPLSLGEILEKHEKGQAYAHILQNADAFPLLQDSNDVVLSFPPIINGRITEVDCDTRDVLIDVTGTDLKAVEDVLNILSTLFVERGADLESVQVVYGDETRITPNLSSEKMVVDMDKANRLLGLSLSMDETSKLLQKMGHMPIMEEGMLKAAIPPYRADILHHVDIVEDIAIAYGYENFEPSLPKAFTPGLERQETRLQRRIIQFMTGLGFLEVVTFTLVGLEDQYTKMRLPPSEGHITNPLTTQTNSLREWLIPSLMQILAANKHRDLPQKLFEVDDVVIKGENETHMAGIATSSRTGFTEIKGHVQAILEALNQEAEISPMDHPSFIPGRCAAISISGKRTGFFGELHPEAITNYGLGYPVTAFEINMKHIVKPC